MIFSAVAYSFASRFNLREATGYFPKDLLIRPGKTQMVAEWSKASFAFAFDFGALVFINVDANAIAQVLSEFQRRLPREPHAPLREDFLLEVRPNAATEVAFDRVVIQEPTTINFEVIATVLAQSVCIDYYDEDAQAILDRIEAIATELNENGRPRGQTRDLMRFVGAAIATQVEIISAIGLLDKPDLTWENESADRLHDKLRYQFEIAERYKALEIKLATIRESLQAFLEMTSSRRMLLLETLVVVLILAELLLSLLHAR